jgi:hypothetical protein
MRSRTEIEKDVESINRDDDGDIHYFHADSDGVQVLILEVLLDIRDILFKGWA